jgi:hypothetical protein
LRVAIQEAPFGRCHIAQDWFRIILASTLTIFFGRAFRGATTTGAMAGTAARPTVNQPISKKYESGRRNTPPENSNKPKAPILRLEIQNLFKHGPARSASRAGSRRRKAI